MVLVITTLICAQSDSHYSTASAGPYKPLCSTQFPPNRVSAGRSQLCPFFGDIGRMLLFGIFGIGAQQTATRSPGNSVR